VQPVDLGLGLENLLLDSGQLGLTGLVTRAVATEVGALPLELGCALVCSSSSRIFSCAATRISLRLLSVSWVVSASRRRASARASVKLRRPM